MASIIPFRAIRPVRNKASLVGSRSYIQYSDVDFQQKLSSNPYTFLHIITATYGWAHSEETSRDQRYSAVRDKFREFMDKGILCQDENPGFYLYRQEHSHFSHTGLIGATAVKDLEDNIIKGHERTFDHREELFCEYLESTGINAEPVLLAHERIPQLDSIYGKYLQQRPEYEFTTTDEVVHNLWVIDDKNDIDFITKTFANSVDLYIADGHHRSASSLRLAKQTKRQMPSKDYFMSIIMDFDSIEIYPFHRKVDFDHEGLANDFLNYLLSHFSVTELSITPSTCDQGLIILYLKEKFFEIDLKKTGQSRYDSKGLDVSILNQFILDPFFSTIGKNIAEHLSFIPGNEPIVKICSRVTTPTEAIFFLAPITMKQIKVISDKGQILPQKSTWIQPKLRSGLTIYSIFEE